MSGRAGIPGRRETEELEGSFPAAAHVESAPRPLSRRGGVESGGYLCRGARAESSRSQVGSAGPKFNVDLCGSPVASLVLNPQKDGQSVQADKRPEVRGKNAQKD